MFCLCLFFCFSFYSANSFDHFNYVENLIVWTLNSGPSPIERERERGQVSEWIILSILIHIHIECCLSAHIDSVEFALANRICAENCGFAVFCILHINM